MIVLYIAISSNTIQVYRGDQRGCSNPSVIDSEFQEKNTRGNLADSSCFVQERSADNRPSFR
jgi:hypothetical protein